jgi:hypothetical protein
VALIEEAIAGDVERTSQLFKFVYGTTVWAYSSLVERQNFTEVVNSEEYVTPVRVAEVS